MESSLSRRLVCGTQGAFFLATGLWPLLHLESFELVTGPKREDWLVKGMGTVLTVVGAALLGGAVRRRVTPELCLLANGVGLGLGALDIFYTARGTIRRVYRLDAVIEAGFAMAWAASRTKGRATTPSAPVTIPPTGSPELD
jgi:hypothetical protein